MGHSNISIFIPHLGCPNCCSFCNQRTISSTSSAPTADEVRELLKSAVTKLKNPENTEIAFFGGSFTAIPRGYMVSLLEAAEPFVKEYGLAGIRLSTRPDCIDGEILSVLKSFGVTSIELGAQSMRDEILAANNRGHSADDVRNACAMIKEYGFETGLQMMTGLYKSTPEDDMFTADEIIRLSPATVRIYPVVILEGTELARLYKSGCYKPVGFEEMTELCADMLVKFDAAGIRVIRLGLHASEELGGSAVGGFYHPAFAEICRSVLNRRRIEGLGLKAGEYTVKVCPKELSAYIGQKRANAVFFANRGVIIDFKADEKLSMGEISVT